MRTGFSNKRISLLWVQISFLLIILIALAGCKEEERPPEVIRSISWMKVVSSDAEQVRIISGVVKPIDESSLSFAVGGTVEKVKVNLGDRAKKDQILAELDKLPFILAVRNAEAALKKSEASLIERRANYERIRDLYASNNVSKAEFDTARASFKSAESQVKAAKAQLGLAHRDLDKAVLRAPYNGVISMKKIEAFEEIPAGRPIFSIDGEESGFEVSVGIPETMIAQITKEQEATVVFPTLNKRCECGVVKEVGTKAEAANIYPVTVKLLELYPEIRSGMSVEVAFKFIAKVPDELSGTSYIIPSTSILTGKDKQYFVFVYDKNTSTVRKTAIQVFSIRENDIIVSSGIQDGDIIATAGTSFLADQQKVKLMQEK